MSEKKESADSYGEIGSNLKAIAQNLERSDQAQQDIHQACMSIVRRLDGMIDTCDRMIEESKDVQRELEERQRKIKKDLDLTWVMIVAAASQAIFLFVLSIIYIAMQSE